MAISPPAPRAGAPLSRRLADTQSSPVRELLETAMQPHIISLAGGLPAPDTFDVAGLRAAFDEVLSGPDAIRALQYSLTEGDPALRERLAAFMAKGGLEATGHDILVTTGSQQALGLVASALCDPGDTILVEDPTYLAALQTFQLADVNAVPIPGDDDGPDPEALIERRPPHRRQGRLPDPDLPEPDRPHDAARAPRGARRGRRDRRPVADRGRPVQRAAPRRRAGRPAGRAARRARAHDRHPDALEGPLARPAHRLPARARRPCAARWRSPSRRRTCTRARSRSSPPSAGWPPTTSASTSRASPPTTARAATRCSPRWASTSRRARA